METFAQIARSIRGNLTHKKFAELTGLGTSTILAIEKGGCPTLHTFYCYMHFRDPSLVYNDLTKAIKTTTKKELLYDSRKQR